MAKSRFAFEGGGGWDYTAAISKAEFVNGKFGPQLELTKKLDEAITKGDGTLMVDRKEFYSIGKDWDPIEAGAEVKHKSGDDDKRFNKNSAVAKLIDRIVMLVGEDTLSAEGRDDPYKGSFYEGLHFQWVTEGEGEDYTVTEEDGTVKKGKKKGKVMPVEYLSSAPPQECGELDVASLNLPDDAINRLTEMAHSSDAGTFMSDAIAMLSDLAELGVTRGNGQDEFIEAVGNGSLYAALSA